MVQSVYKKRQNNEECCCDDCHLFKKVHRFPEKNQRTDMKTIAGASLQVIDFPGCGEPPLSGGVKEVTRQVFHLVVAIDIRTTVVTSQRFIGRHPAPRQLNETGQ